VYVLEREREMERWRDREMEREREGRIGGLTPSYRNVIASALQDH
jgi:hypothetical protein